MKLTAAIQESLVCLMLYDPEALPVVRALVPVDAFGSYYCDFALQAVQYFDKYGKVPGDHTLDILNTLKASNQRDAEVYQKVYDSLLDTKEGINREYVIDQAGDYSRFARANQTVGQVLEILKKPVGKNELTVIDNLFAGHQQQVASMSDPGTSIRDRTKFLSFLGMDSAEAMPTGIGPIDERNLGPTKKNLWMFMANTGKGKSWCCSHLAKESGILARNKTLIISCEMSEQAYCQRLTQTLFGISKRKFSEHRFITFERDEKGTAVSFNTKEIAGRPSFKNDDIQRVIAKRLDGIRTPVIIKQFPTRELTLPVLEAYITSLEWQAGFIPDLLLIDYPDLFKYDPHHERTELAAIYGGLRGVSIRRNLALVCPTQANRAGEDAQELKGKHVGFAYEKMQLADICFTYNQSKMEKQLGLCRLGCLKGRSEEDGFEIMMSQKYEIGQFCMDAVRMNRNNYFDLIEQAKDDD